MIYFTVEVCPAVQGACEVEESAGQLGRAEALTPRPWWRLMGGFHTPRATPSELGMVHGKSIYKWMRTRSTHRTPPYFWIKLQPGISLGYRQHKVPGGSQKFSLFWKRTHLLFSSFEKAYEPTQRFLRNMLRVSSLTKIRDAKNEKLVEMRLGVLPLIRR